MTAARKIYYLDLMGISHRSYFAEKLVTFLEGAGSIGVKKQKFDGWSLDRPLKISIAGNIIDVKQTARAPRKINVQWLDADTYVDLNTGEICEASHSETRGDEMSVPEVRRTLSRMRGLINANFYGDENEKLVTITYHENMTDPVRLQRDLDVFVKRMKRKLGELKYITAVEPQGRGAWHAHMLVKQLTSNSTYLTEEMVQEIWEHGWIVDVQPLRDVDNVGAYLSAYLSNAPDKRAGTELSKLTGSQRQVPKRVIKGARLSMYPRGMHIYRSSRNLDQPEQKIMRPLSAEYQQLIADARLVYEQRLDLIGQGEDDANYLINSISHRSYNRKSKEAQS